MTLNRGAGSMRALLAAMVFAIAAAIGCTPATAQRITGVAAPYDVVTLSIDGPVMDERSGTNPFSDVRLDLIIQQSSRQWMIPGYFAGCANAADSGCTSGRLWQAHFLPPAQGVYQWRVQFRSGPDIVLTERGGTPLAGHNATGSFTVSGAQRDAIRARGVLHYTGDPYYRYSGDGSIFWKFGPDAPENMLAYDDFDDTPNYNGLRKSWAPHLRDYDAADGRGYTWRGGRGHGLLGMMRYVAGTGMNSISALTWNTGGDDRNVFPHLLAVSPDAYAAMERTEQWRAGVVQDRFDISKLAQWQRSFAYADHLGLHINMKLQETENDRFMDGGALGRTRRLYLREMVARFGHYLALTWNMGEENVQAPGDVAQMSYYVDGLDAYDRPIVIHSYPPQKERYRPLLGTGSAINGMSLQSRRDDIRAEMARWRMEAAVTGRHWVLSFDEQARAQDGVGVDADYPADRLPQPRTATVPRDVVRREIIWSALTAGGNGGEAYYGYQTGCSDLTCQDHRTRASIWRDAAVALGFFREHVGEAALDMRMFDELTDAAAGDYVFADPGQLYVIYRDAQNATALQMPGIAGRFDVAWFDPVNGGVLQRGSVTMLDLNGGFAPDQGGYRPAQQLGDPPAGGSGEWVVVVRRMADEMIIVEAENFIAQHADGVRRWYRVDDAAAATPEPDPDPRHLERASGGAYLELLPDTRTTHDDRLIAGDNFTEAAGSVAVLTYDVSFPAAGRYYVWTRIFATGTEDNGLHVGINGNWPASGRRIQFCSGRGQWFWDNRQRTEAQHCGVPGGVWIDVPAPGVHRVSFAMREDGVEFDAFFLTRDARPPAGLLRTNRAVAPAGAAAEH